MLLSGSLISVFAALATEEAAGGSGGGTGGGGWTTGAGEGFTASLGGGDGGGLGGDQRELLSQAGTPFFTIMKPNSSAIRDPVMIW